ncbi:MAG: preprotein translocase subunit SecY [Clostridiales bacterium]|jgi:preprotein translocase subunit SecY|nr:preprotein translocase subunit SecY [Clostridiales bacterium]
MLKVFVNAWKIPDIRKKMLYILLILAIYRIGCHIPVPGVDLQKYMGALRQTPGDFTSLFSIIAGGGYGTILALGIGPYITSSIIMQLLTVAIPKLEQIQKEGEEGRKKINQYTRVVAVALAFLQGSGMIYRFRELFTYPNFFVYAIATFAMVTGTIFVMWLGEVLTEKGIGNGSSFLIFSNIISNLPSAVGSMYQNAVGSWVNVVKVVAVILVFIALMAFVVLVQDGERRIPVQYSRKMVGRQMYGGQSSYIPIKVNIAGVMSIIFAISLLQFPSLVAQFIPNATTGAFSSIIRALDITSPAGAVLYVILIFFFTFFYTSFSINPVEMAENMKKNGGFIPGVRPGKPTSDYISKIISRLSWIGALVYAIIAIMPVVFQWVFSISVGFGGTTLLIVTGVCLELVKQLESQMLMRHYKGFL